jgi:hypothetical protein
MVGQILVVLLVGFTCACLGVALGGSIKNPAPWARRMRRDTVLGIAFMVIIGPVLIVLVENR